MRLTPLLSKAASSIKTKVPSLRRQRPLEFGLGDASITKGQYDGAPDLVTKERLATKSWESGYAFNAPYTDSYDDQLLIRNLFKDWESGTPELDNEVFTCIIDAMSRGATETEIDWYVWAYKSVCKGVSGINQRRVEFFNQLNRGWANGIISKPSVGERWTDHLDAQHYAKLVPRTHYGHSTEYLQGVRLKEELRRQRETREREEVRRKEEARRLKKEEAERKLYANRKLKDKFIKDAPKPFRERMEGFLQGRMAAGFGDKLMMSPIGVAHYGSDLDSLLNNKWLKGKTLTAYCGIVANHANEKKGIKVPYRKGTTPGVIAMTTEFYEGLMQKGPKMTPHDLFKWGFNMGQKVKQGGKLVEQAKPSNLADLLKVEAILIPINKGGSHWVLAVIFPALRKIRYVDSFGDPNPRVTENLRLWLAFILGPLYREDEWTEEILQGPKQTDGSSCGVFTCSNAELSAGGIELDCYTQQDLKIQRWRIGAVLLNGRFDASKGLASAIDLQ